ncbi:class I SAM-dependent methyltransferase [bacterium]|nr:class I SAM-dependent methyltransferase [bacterium]
MSLTQMCHQEIIKHQKIFLYSIDATCGNGHDTAFLLKNTQAQGHVFAFDVQQQAILTTQKKCAHDLNKKQLSFFQASHSKMTAFIPKRFYKKIDLIMFNLGYLPGSQNKTICTQEKTTLLALDQCSQLLKPGGIVSVLAYPGHRQGKEEKESIESWINQQTLYIYTEHHDIKKNNAPILWLLHLKK